MNQEDILKMAREADCGHESMTLDWITPNGLERFAALVAAKAAQDERVKFAKLCDAYGANFKELSAKNDGRASDMAFGQATAAESLAHAIRAKG